MVGHGGSSAGSYLADPTSPIPSHCASIVVTSTLRVETEALDLHYKHHSSINHVYLTFWFCNLGALYQVQCFGSTVQFINRNVTLVPMHYIF